MKAYGAGGGPHGQGSDAPRHRDPPSHDERCPSAGPEVASCHEPNGADVKLIECVPNFSEGRDRTVIDAITGDLSLVN
jgi:hypothetical protein